MNARTLPAWRLVAGAIHLSLLAAFAGGCAAPPSYFGRGCVARALRAHTGHTLARATPRGEIAVPEPVDWRDGITEQEAVAMALWNSPRYQELLADLGLSRAALVEAGQLTNPQFWAVVPVGVKQLEFALNVSVEALWLRPKRLAAAQLESQRIGNRLVQDGLDLMRDVRVAFADLVLADERLRLADQSVRLRSQITELAEARLRAGSASELEVMTARIDKLMEQQRAGRLAHDAELAAQRLRLLMGVEFSDIAVEAVGPSDPPELPVTADRLVEQALAWRPDLWAAEFSLRAARQRARLARWDYLNVLAVFPDANSDGKRGFEAGPGVTFTVPLFHQNQGAIARANAEVEKAQRRCETLHHQVATEVRQACVKLAQAREDLDKWRHEIVPVTIDAVATSERAYQDGGASLLLMLVNSRQLLDSKLRQAEAAADLHKALAELERSVGRPVVGAVSQATTAATASDVTTAATLHLPLDTIETLP